VKIVIAENRKMFVEMSKKQLKQKNNKKGPYHVVALAKTVPFVR